MMVAPASLACWSWVPSWAPSMAPTMMTLAPLVIMALIWFCCSETPPLANCTSGLKPAPVRPSLNSFSARTQFSLVFWGSATPIEESFGKPRRRRCNRRWFRCRYGRRLSAPVPQWQRLLLPFLLYQSFALLGSLSLVVCGECVRGAGQGTAQASREMISLVEVVSSGWSSLLRRLKFFISMPMIDCLPWVLL